MRKWGIGKEPAYRRQQQSAGTQKAKTQKHEERVAAIQSVSTTIDRMAQEQTADREQRERHETGKANRDYATIKAIFAGAVAALIAVAVAHCDTRDVIREAHDSSTQQHNDTLAALSKTDAVIAESRRLADAAQRSADVTENSQRAWIAPEVADLISKPDDTERLTIRILFRNTGQEPAPYKKLINGSAASLLIEKQQAIRNMFLGEMIINLFNLIIVAHPGKICCGNL